MKKVLFIIQSYPSERSANVLCDEKIMKELQKTGEYEIHCLTYQYEWQKREDIIDGFYIHRIKKSIFWDIYTWSRHHAEKKITKLIHILHRINLRIKQTVTIPIYPCYEPINSLIYAGSAKKLYKKYKFDLVFAEHNGFDTLYAGHKLKQYAGDNITFIAALWDPFTGSKLAKYLPQKYAERRMEKSEAKILNNADCVIAMHSSKPYHMQHSSKKPWFSKYRFLDIPGIVEPVIKDLPDNYTNPDMINLLYAGHIFVPDRDPSFLIDCIDQVKWPKPVNLIFLCAGKGKEVLEEKKKTFHGTIMNCGYVDQDELHQIMNNVDGFLNIGSYNPGMVPSKIFEYMSYGKPVISTYVDESDASKEYLEKYPLGICLNKDLPNENNVELLQTFAGEKIGLSIPFSEVKHLFTENTPSSYLSIIEDTMNDMK